MAARDRELGWYNKYNIEKNDGTPVDPNAQYFVLRIDKDPAARSAALMYAYSVRATNPQLANDIEAMVAKYNNDEPEIYHI